jgi:hypothetical protein
MTLCQGDLIEQTLGQSRPESLLVKNDIFGDWSSAFYSLFANSLVNNIKNLHFFDFISHLHDLITQLQNLQKTSLLTLEHCRSRVNLFFI